MIRWAEVQNAIFPIKSYEDLCHRLSISLGYHFIHAAYNFSLPKLEEYTQKLLGGDPRKRYTVYSSRLTGILKELYKAGVKTTVELKDRTASREHLELLSEQCGISGAEIATLLKYLAYWVIPTEKYLSSLVRGDMDLLEATRLLGSSGIRMNLELLQVGITLAGRQSLSLKNGLPPAIITGLVNRADFSRLPWASKATISNIIGAGYSSLRQLANADPDRLVSEFLRYGTSIGKNLKLGNEIETTYRISKIIPKVLLGS